ncbi:MAG: hypothetical protein KDA80_07315, partial [Planctomycetaceae bacterium]|nr:hypothetical protein [Planctomycetaceae bacterium]
MKRYPPSLKSQHHHPSRRTGGAVIIVVLSLMTVMVFLGLFFYNWTSQERANAENYADTDPMEIDPDPIFETVLRQAIVGPRPSENQSVLHGGHYAILASIFGRPELDGTNDRLVYQPFPYTGSGARIIAPDGNGDGIPDSPYAFGIDYDGNGTADRNETDFIVNFSRAANGGSVPTIADDFFPNAGYTYPDLNSMFLAFDEEVIEENTTETRRVVIPGYFRPQLFLQERQAGAPTAFNDLYTNATTANQVLRPHETHQAIDSGGMTLGARYLTSNTIAQSGDRNRLIEAFPFSPDDDGDGNANEAGVFSTININDFNYEYDGDVDRDGVKDSILLDLGYPIINLPNGRQVVPMAMMKWVDNDALLNVNAHGNFNGLTIEGRGIADKEPYSESNQGLSSFEVNLGLGLTADPTLSDDIASLNVPSLFIQHRGMFGQAPSDRIDASNMELLNLLVGRQQFQSDSMALISNTPILGRYGDSGNLTTFASWAQANIIGPSPLNAMGFDIPRPGQPNVDDDQDVGYDPQILSFGHPLDYLGTGETTNPPAMGTNGATRKMVAINSLNYPAYDENWSESSQPTTTSPNPRLNTIEDESDEFWIEPALRDTSVDSAFPPSEIFGLHGSEADLFESWNSSDLRELASFNFRDSRQNRKIARRFTTDSWDRLEFSMEPDFTSSRPWEFNTWIEMGATYSIDYTNPISGSTVTENFELAFPPQFGDPMSDPQVEVYRARDPFRPQLRRLLTTLIDTTPTTTIPWGEMRRSSAPNLFTDAIGALGQRLRLNGILDTIGANGIPEYKRLEIHPTGLAAAPPMAGSPEFLARQERQRLARDIYVLLYTLCGGVHEDVTTLTGGTRPYTDPEVTQMAQFAVNLVDEMDPDSVMTRFEFDIDLGNGWSLDDDPYTIDGGSDRLVVTGVERQQLTINEVLFVHSEDEGMDETNTEWDDTADRSFCYIELRNPGYSSLNIDNDWQIQLEIPGVPTMELTLNTATITAGDIFSIGSAGDDHNTNGGMGGPGPSFMRVNADTGGGTQYETVVPKSGALDLDLITADPNTDFTLVDSSSPSNRVTTLGAFFPPTVSDLCASNPGTTITVRLRRRVNLDRTMPTLGDSTQNNDNPWVTVDEVEVDSLGEGTPATDGGWYGYRADQSPATEVRNLRSQERGHPLDRSSAASSPANGQVGTMPNVLDTYNSFGDQNSTAGGGAIWQVHFDRDFTSIVDLFSIPLYGPDDVTRRTVDGSGRMSGLRTSGGNNFAALAGRLFLNPEQQILPAVSETNRWYRFLEFVQVIPQNLNQIGDFNNGVIPVMRRTPGRINLNTLRHETVLAGLIDDELIERYGDFPTSTEPSLGFDGSRNWFRELQKSRDGADQILRSAGTPAELRIPGLPG